MQSTDVLLINIKLFTLNLPQIQKFLRRKWTTEFHRLHLNVKNKLPRLATKWIFLAILLDSKMYYWPSPRRDIQRQLSSSLYDIDMTNEQLAFSGNSEGELSCHILCAQ